jgi:outer membrane protein TolC
LIPAACAQDQTDLRGPIRAQSSQEPAEQRDQQTGVSTTSTPPPPKEGPGLVTDRGTSPEALLGNPPYEPKKNLPQPSPGSSLDQLYPIPAEGTPYSAGASDPVLTSKQKEEADSVTLTPIPASQLIPIGDGKLPPIKLEASFNEPISLRQVLRIALDNNLAIRISQASYDSQKYLFMGSLGGFLPDFTMTYRGQRIDSDSSVASQIFTNSTTLRYPVFQGGRVVYNSAVNWYRTKAARNAYNAAINDVLLDAYRRYYDMLLNQSLLQIRIKSVELSRAQLRLNQQLKDAGVGTNFAVYQSRTQLALDKQALLQQQVLVRQASLQLARVLNTSMAINLIPRESQVREIRLVQPATSIQEHMAMTMKLRPELKQFEALRMAARRNVQVQQASLYPTFQFFTSATETQSFRSGYTQTFQNTVLNQLQVLSQNTNAQAASAANNGGGGGGGGGGGNAASGLSGSTVIIPTGAGGGGIGISGGGGRNLSMGFDLSWNLTGMGVSDLASTLSAQALARQALLQSNQQYLNVVLEVRNSYLNMLTAREQVDVAAEALVSAAEQLRLANLRVTYGQGINLELIQAQRDYVTALTNHVQAIIAYNVSQAQLLRDTGQISLATLTTEYNRPIGIRKPPSTN